MNNDHSAHEQGTNRAECGTVQFDLRIERLTERPDFLFYFNATF